MKIRVALMGGMGYPATELPAGMPTFKTKLEALGAEVILVSWHERQAVYNFMNGFDGSRVWAGDSLGAGSAGQYPGDVRGKADYAAGFQPSLYDARSHNGIQTIAANIVRAHCIYDSRWVDTFGLGNARWQIAHGSTTKLIITDHHGAHPDDWCVTQNWILSDIKELIKIGRAHV